MAVVGKTGKMCYKFKLLVWYSCYYLWLCWMCLMWLFY